MGIRSVAVHSDADAGALHTRLADVAVPIGPAPAAQSYLSIERVLEAAARTGAQAIHPGYGFLSENVEFARACEKAGVVFIGPPVAAIEAMGDKIRAKQTVSAAGVPVVPGRTEPGMDDDAVAAAAVAVGFPVLLKPSAGGGGKGMRVVRDRGRARRGHRRRPPRGPRLLRRRHPAGRALHRQLRGTSRCRCSATPRQRDPPRRARVQPAAPAPEGDRGGAVAAARHRRTRRDGPRGGRGGEGGRLHRRGHRRVHRRRPTRPATTSSSSR